MMRWLIASNVLSLLITSVTAIFFFLPITFESPPCTRFLFIDAILPRCGPNHWVKSMKVDQLSNFILPFPSPHLDVSDRKLLHFWRLPRGTRLSERMKDIGRCRLALAQGKNSSTTDPIICNRIDVPWSAIAMPIALLNMAVCLVYECIPDRGRWLAVFAWISWFVPVVTYGWPSLDDKTGGVTYTLYGDLYPSPYYQKGPWVWFAACILCGVNCVLKFIEFIVWISVIKRNEKARKSEETRRLVVPPSRPSEEPQHFYNLLPVPSEAPVAGKDGKFGTIDQARRKFVEKMIGDDVHMIKKWM